MPATKGSPWATTLRVSGSLASATTITSAIAAADNAKTLRQPYHDVR